MGMGEDTGSSVGSTGPWRRRSNICMGIVSKKLSITKAGAGGV